MVNFFPLPIFISELVMDLSAGQGIPFTFYVNKAIQKLSPRT